MRLLPINTMKKAMPLVASAMLATTAIIAGAKQDKTVNDNKEAVPAALALATFVPLATIRRKEGVEKTFNPDLYDAKMNALLKRRWVNQYTYNIVKAICENDKIDVETAKNLPHWFNPDEKAVERLTMIVNANQIKNENLPNVFRAAEDTFDDNDMVKRFLNDNEFNNKPINAKDLREIFLNDDKYYDKAKRTYKIIEDNGLENEIKIRSAIKFAIQSKYLDKPHVGSYPKEWGEIDNKALKLLPQFEAEGLIERLDDENLEKSKVELIKKYINNNTELSEQGKLFFASWSHKYIKSEETLEYFDILMKNADRFDNGIARVMDIITEWHDPNKALNFFKGLLASENGSLEKYIPMILSQR